MMMTDAWIAVGIFIIIFEVLFLILHCIFSAEYHRNVKRIDELGKKSEADVDATPCRFTYEETDEPIDAEEAEE